MLNEKAYALSVRDDTSFRVEGGSGGSSGGNGYRIAKVTVIAPNELADAIFTGPFIYTNESTGTAIYGDTFLDPGVTEIFDVIVTDDYPTIIKFYNGSIESVSGSATLVTDMMAFVTGDATITLSDAQPR